MTQIARFCPKLCCYHVTTTMAPTKSWESPLLVPNVPCTASALSEKAVGKDSKIAEVVLERARIWEEMLPSQDG